MKIWTLFLYCMISFITKNSYATRDLQLRDLFVEENPYLSTGALSICASTGSGFASPRGMNINNDFIYVTNSGANNSVSKCTINTVTGALTSCGTTSGFTDPRGIFIF